MRCMTLFFTAICFCLVSFSNVEAQQGKKRARPQQKVSQPKRSAEQPATNKPQPEKQLSEPKFSLAMVTFLDGSTQQWGNLRFVYEDSRLPSKNSPVFKYLAGSLGSMLFIDNVSPDPGYRIEAVYSEKPEFMHVLLGVKGAEGGIVGRSCGRDTPCIGSAGISIKGTCLKGGQRKACSAYLVPPTGSDITDRGKLVKEIVFIEKSSPGQSQQPALFNRIPSNASSDVSQAIEGLYSFDPQKRADAAKLLWEMDAKASPAIPFLVEMLSDEDAIEVGEERDHSGRVTKRYTTPSVIAAKALGKIGKPAVQALIAVLSDQENDLNLRERSASALGETRDPGAVEALIVAIKEKDKDLRTTTIEALGKIEIKDPRTVESVINILSDVLKDKNTRFRGGGLIDIRDHKAAMGVLAKIKDPRAVESLINALKHEDEYVRIEAAEALGETNDPRVVEPLIAALKDQDHRVRRGAVWSLGKTKDARAVEPLIAATKDREVDSDAIRALGGIKDPRAVEPLTIALKDGRNWIREAAVEALGDLKDARAVDALITALKDSINTVAIKAAKSLASIGDPRAVTPLIDVLRNASNVWTRSGVAEALGMLKDARAVEPLIVALKEVSRYPAARESVEKALKEITGQDFGGDSEKWKSWWEQNKLK